MNKSKNQILIVDDEPDIREVLELTLGRMNLETRSASNLEEARHLLGDYQFDLCLTDMRLPDGNGIELVRFIQEKHPYLPVAVITAFGNRIAMEETLEQSLQKLFTGGVASETSKVTALPESGSGVKDLAIRLRELYRRSQEFMRQGNEELKKMEPLLEQMQKQKGR